jgi:enhancing lycopene biosynthesis protein 2
MVSVLPSEKYKTSLMCTVEKDRQKKFNSVKEAKRNCHFMCVARYLVKLIKYRVTLEIASDLCSKGA